MRHEFLSLQSLSVQVIILMRTLLGCLVLFSLLGCGGATKGVAVQGTVLLDGQPLPWGRIYLRGATDDKTKLVDQAVCEIRDGKFDSGPMGLPPGSAEVTIFVHMGAAPEVPASNGEETQGSEPQVVGTWDGNVEVQADAPLSFELKQAELQPVDGVKSRPRHSV